MDVHSNQTVAARLDLRLVTSTGSTLPVRADLHYDPRDPYAVRVAFHTGGPEVVEWTFARELLTEGVSRASGEGDVQVWPSSDDGRPIVYLALSSPSGRALFETGMDELVGFLTRTYVAVPTGSESDHLEIDAALRELLDS